MTQCPVLRALDAAVQAATVASDAVHGAAELITAPLLNPIRRHINALILPETEFEDV